MNDSFISRVPSSIGKSTRSSTSSARRVSIRVPLKRPHEAVELQSSSSLSSSDSQKSKRRLTFASIPATPRNSMTKAIPGLQRTLQAGRHSTPTISHDNLDLDESLQVDDDGDFPSTSSLAPFDARIKVYVRVRPENQTESQSNHRRVVQPIDDQICVFDPVSEENLEESFTRFKTPFKEPGKKQNKNLQFHFDRVFNEEATNMEVYEAVTKKFINSFLDGYNCAVFAYGATGSGKTHTMLGSPEDPGVMFFTTMELFRQIESRCEEEQLELSISYFEIYNELVYDLLTPALIGKQLAVREDPKRGVVVKNLSVHQPKDANHLLDMLEFGNKNRTQHPTDANAESSRSHAVFQVFLKKQDYSSSQEMSIQLSKMSLIDLAGSERASVAYKTNRIKSVQREGSNINKSLLALGNCINALARREGKGKRKEHIPYRDSKLTLLLRDSLGGSCHTAMIAAVSPSSLSYEDTHNTLTYANRAKGITLNLTKNNILVPLQQKDLNQALESMSRKVSDLQEENDLLKMELDRFKSQSLSNINSKEDVLQEKRMEGNQVKDVDCVCGRKLFLPWIHQPRVHWINLLANRGENLAKDNLKEDRMSLSSEIDDFSPNV